MSSTIYISVDPQVDTEYGPSRVNEDRQTNTPSELAVGREFDLPDEDEGLGFHRDGLFKQ